MCLPLLLNLKRSEAVLDQTDKSSRQAQGTELPFVLLCGIRTSPLYSICPKIYYYHDQTFKPSVELWKDLLFLIFSQDPL